MTDDNTASRNYNRRLAQEYAELDNPVVRAQIQLDAHWQRRLDERARARRREIPERGIYDEMKRFEEEVADGLIGWGNA